MRSSLAKALGQAVTRCFEPGSDLDVHRAINDVISREFQGQFLKARWTDVINAWLQTRAKSWEISKPTRVRSFWSTKKKIPKPHLSSVGRLSSSSKHVYNQ